MSRLPSNPEVLQSGHKASLGSGLVVAAVPVLVVLAALLALGRGPFGSFSRSSVSTPQGSPPPVRFLESRVDLGAVVWGDVLVFDLVLSNEGADAVSLHEVEAHVGAWLIPR